MTDPLFAPAKNSEMKLPPLKSGAAILVIARAGIEALCYVPPKSVIVQCTEARVAAERRNGAVVPVLERHWNRIAVLLL